MMMVAANVRADGTDMARSGQRGAGAGEEIGRGGVSAREFQPVWMLVEVHLLTRRRFVINCHSSQGTSAITIRSTGAFPGPFRTLFCKRGCHKKKLWRVRSLIPVRRGRCECAEELCGHWIGLMSDEEQGPRDQDKVDVRTTCKTSEDRRGSSLSAKNKRVLLGGFSGRRAGHLCKVIPLLSSPQVD